MKKVFITLTGTKHYFGNDFLKKDMKIRLEKEPENEYDKEAIKVTYKKRYFCKMYMGSKGRLFKSNVR